MRMALSKIGLLLGLFFFFFWFLCCTDCDGIQDLSSLARDWIHAASSGSAESYQQDCQGSPLVGPFFFKCIYFNWRLITLQYYICFAIHWRESATGIHVLPILNPPPFPSHPSGSSQCISPEHPVSCIEPGLAIHFLYDIIHVSMPFPQIIPPSPSLTESKRLFYTSVSLLLSRIQGYCYHLSNFHIYVLVYCIGVFLSGLLHSVLIGSSFIHLIRTDSNVFFLMAE